MVAEGANVLLYVHVVKSSVPPTSRYELTGIDRASPIPYYFQLQQILHGEIGDLRPGDRLPGEHELCELFDVSRSVVRQALGELEKEGLVRRRKGHGTFVAPRMAPDFRIQELRGTYEQVVARGGQIHSLVRRLQVEPCPRPIATELAVPEDTAVTLLDRLRYVDGRVWVATTTYIPQKLCPDLVKHDMSDKSLYGLLENDYGVRIAYGRRWTEASLATPSLGEALEIEEGAPVLMISGTSYTADSTPVEHFISYYSGDRLRFEVVLSRSGSMLRHEALRASVPPTPVRLTQA